MKLSSSFFLTALILMSLTACSQKGVSTSVQKDQLHSLKAQIEENLKSSLLPYWSYKTIDTLNGGFYGRIDSKEQVYPGSDKGGILNARLLWTYSSAFRVLKDSSYLQLATYAKDYILEHFLDKEYGGGYNTVKADGAPGDTRKYILTESYFIYALAEYYRATGNKNALDEAIKIFDLVERYAFDSEYNGYFEVYTRDWQRSRDRMLNEKSDRDEKTMITHLHLLEAYAGLYRVWPDKRMEERLRNILEIFNNRIIDQRTFHTKYFLDREWNATSQIDSYGHDIEGSWLMTEAAGLLKDPQLLKKVEKLSLRVAEAAAEGLQPDGSLLTEKNRITGETVENRSWWEQAETIVGYLNAFELTGKQRYLDIVLNAWNYVKEHFVDYANGGWYPIVLPEGKPGGRDKVNYWTCPYHNGRMCMEVIERIKE